ncbi:unnamed protein product [Withania somnifera]
MSCSFNRLSTSSSGQLLVTTDLSSQLNISFRVSNAGMKQKRSPRGHHGVPKVFAYYGLKTPPYKLDALEPYMSQRMLEVHWGEHHRGYVEALNKQLEKNDILYGCTMEELIKVTYNNGNPFPEFSDAAQVILKREEKRLAIIKTSNAVNPLVWNDIPLVGLDLWEHAYYLDYKNDKAKYVNVFMNHLVSWNAALGRMARAQAFVNLGEPKIPVA